MGRHTHGHADRQTDSVRKDRKDRMKQAREKERRRVGEIKTPLIKFP